VTRQGIKTYGHQAFCTYSPGMVFQTVAIGEQPIKETLPVGFLATIFTINMLALLNFSSVFVAMIKIGKALDAPEILILQLPTSLFAAIACAAPMTPYLLHRLGARRLLTFAVIGLCVTTVLASLCQTFWQLIVVLFIHGLFCAPLSPATQAAVKETLNDRDLGVGMAVWGAGNYAGGLIGPLLAGVMITVFGWRSLFLIPLPFVLLVIPLILFVIKTKPDKTARPDAVSMMIAPIAMLLLVGTASLGPSLSWFASPLVMVSSVCLAFAVPLCVWSYRRHGSPSFHLGCLRNRDTWLSLLIVFVFNMVSTGLFQVEYLEKDAAIAPETIGLRSSIAAATLLVGFTIAGWCCKQGHYALSLLAGLGLTFIAKVGFLLYSSDSGALAAIWPVVFSGLSFGMVIGVTAVLAYRAISETHVPHVATGFILATYLGASLGAGLLNEVLLVFDAYFIQEEVAAQAAILRAFKSEFVVELVISALIIWPAFLLVRKPRKLLV
jgi:MFS family permease